MDIQTSAISTRKYVYSHITKTSQAQNVNQAYVLLYCDIIKSIVFKQAEAQNLSMDNSGQMLGGGFCDECQDFTAGINCHECVDGYFRPEGVLPNATEPCVGMFIKYKKLA